jgi:hypothetical protein
MFVEGFSRFACQEEEQGCGAAALQCLQLLWSGGHFAPVSVQAKDAFVPGTLRCTATTAAPKFYALHCMQLHLQSLVHVMHCFWKLGIGRKQPALPF